MRANTGTIKMNRKLLLMSVILTCVLLLNVTIFVFTTFRIKNNCYRKFNIVIQECNETEDACIVDVLSKESIICSYVCSMNSCPNNGTIFEFLELDHNCQNLICEYRISSLLRIISGFILATIGFPFIVFIGIYIIDYYLNDDKCYQQLV